MHRRDSGLDQAVDPSGHRELEENLHPPHWRNPVPAARYGMVVIGAGPAGLAAARDAAAAGVSVALVERDLIGGDCINYGCEPSKALIRSARLYAEMREARHYGVSAPTTVEVDFPAAMRRVLELRARLSRKTSPRMLKEAGIDLFFGDARFSGVDRLEVDGLP